MTEREKIISLARECGFQFLSQWGIPSCEVKDIEALYHAAQKEAFELAALVCDTATTQNEETECRLSGGERYVIAGAKEQASKLSVAIRQLIKEQS